MPAWEPDYVALDEERLRCTEQELLTIAREHVAHPTSLAVLPTLPDCGWSAERCEPAPEHRSPITPITDHRSHQSPITDHPDHHNPIPDPDPDRDHP